MPETQNQPGSMVADEKQLPVQKIILGLITPIDDTVVPWLGGVDFVYQHSPFMEYLVQLDSNTSEWKPMLAKTWEVNATGDVWTFELEQGVQFHRDFGEFTAADVEHSFQVNCQIGTRASYKGGICNVDHVEILDPHNIRVHTVNPSAEYLFYAAESAGNMISSKAQCDAAGGFDVAANQASEGCTNAYYESMAGTGPYQYDGRVEEVHVDYSVAFPDGHWRHDPDYPEMRNTWVLEEATRLAQFRAGETHMTEVNRDLGDRLVEEGFKIIQSTGPAQQTAFRFGGMFYADPENYDPDFPVTAPGEIGIKVRKALNKAVDRETFKQELYKGRVWDSKVHSFHPDLTPWDTKWDDDWEEEYGFDIEASKQLLIEAGYPEGFEIIVPMYPFPGAPELPQIAQFMQLAWAEIGVTLTLRDEDRAAVVGRRNNKANHETAVATTPSFKAQEAQMMLFNTPKSDGGAGLHTTMGADERAVILKQMGDIKFYEHEWIPLFWVPIETIVDPKIICAWPFPGWEGGDLGSNEEIEAPPC
ncbi:Heme-binding protein A [Geodia barretti]|uniref:Heme-binding protein A n=1 Tax=Geodia barretti TaxID=519541 RepID=A0AA35R0M7_GEOBA|nr:Heme-binding protein A [Geodia barretti]